MGKSSSSPSTCPSCSPLCRTEGGNADCPIFQAKGQSNNEELTISALLQSKQEQMEAVLQGMGTPVPACPACRLPTLSALPAVPGSLEQQEMGRNCGQWKGKQPKAGVTAPSQHYCLWTEP